MLNLKPANDYIILEPIEFRQDIEITEGKIRNARRTSRNRYNFEFGKVLTPTTEFKLWEKVFFRKNICARLGRYTAVKEKYIIGRYCPYEKT